MAIKIDLRVPPCGPANEVADFVRQCEDAGFDGVGMLDSQLLERDIFVSMALAAQATEKIRISAAVLNPVTRHISVTASAAKTVAELAPGRIEFWIGRGFSSVQTIGVPPATVREMRRSVLDLKSILAGEEVSYNGAVSRMRHGNADMPPIYIAATGPRITEVAGEVADGVLLQVGIHPKSVEVARQHLDEGARRAERDPKDLKIILCATTVIHEDQHEARELVRPMCVQRLMEGSHTRYLQAAGIDPGDLEIPAELNELYPDVIHAEDWERAVCELEDQGRGRVVCEAEGRGRVLHKTHVSQYCIKRTCPYIQLTWRSARYCIKHTCPYIKPNGYILQNSI